MKRKTGNIEDFVTRWGGAYGYMITLDADSLMSGRAMMGLVERMDANPAVGLIQAPPKLVRGKTVFARMLQFAGELYGPLSAAGLSYWALGEGNYWGHNAIIRVAPFAELCGLPLLSGQAPLGGEIMSHDFVEAALLRRGGWQVWIADDLGESLRGAAAEHRRLRDPRPALVPGQHAASQGAVRARPALGQPAASGDRHPLLPDLAAVAAVPAGFCSAGLGADLWRPVYFTDGWPFPTLPVSVSAEAALLLGMTLGLLFLPKLFGLLLALIDGPRRRSLGGGRAACDQHRPRDHPVGVGGTDDDAAAHQFRAHHPAGLGDRLAAATSADGRRPPWREREPVRLGNAAGCCRGDRDLPADATIVLLADPGAGRIWCWPSRWRSGPAPSAGASVCAISACCGLSRRPTHRP